MALGFSVVEKKGRAARFHHTALVAPNALVLAGEDVRREYKTSPDTTINVPYSNTSKCRELVRP
jgi:hypothetical protein